MDALTEAVERAAEYGGGPERVWLVPETAAVGFDTTTQGHPLDGLTITHWSHDGHPYGRRKADR
jgi:hypothetical protein